MNNNLSEKTVESIILNYYKNVKTELDTLDPYCIYIQGIGKMQGSLLKIKKSLIKLSDARSQEDKELLLKFKKFYDVVYEKNRQRFEIIKNRKRKIKDQVQDSKILDFIQTNI